MAAEFFARARKLVLQRLEDQECSSRKGGSPTADVEAFNSRGRAGGGRCAPLTTAHPVHGEVRDAMDRSVASASNVGGETDGRATMAEFHPEAMRLDRCMAVAICRQGPAAF